MFRSLSLEGEGWGEGESVALAAMPGLAPAGELPFLFRCIDDPTSPPPAAVPSGARQSGPAHKLGPLKTAGLRHMRRKTPASPVLLGGAAGARKSKAESQTTQRDGRRVRAVLLLTHLPVGDAEKHSDNGSCPGPMSEARRAEFRSRPIGASIAGQSRSDRHLRVAFSWFLLLAKQKKGLAPRRGVKRQDQKKDKPLHPARDETTISPEWQ